MAKGTDKGQSAKAALDFLEEVVWALSSKSPTSLKKGIQELRKISTNAESRNRLARAGSIQTSTPREGSSQFLIGVLPQLLADEELFPSNQNIEKFAREVLGISISRWEKRSRYEMIGILIMEVRLLPESSLDALVQILERLVAKDPGMERLKRDSVQVGFSWNETIRKLGDS